METNWSLYKWCINDTDRLLINLCSSGVVELDSVAVLLLIMLPFADSVSLRVALGQFSFFNSNDSREAKDPEFSLESLPDRRKRIKILALVLHETISVVVLTLCCYRSEPWLYFGGQEREGRDSLQRFSKALLQRSHA